MTGELFVKLFKHFSVMLKRGGEFIQKRDVFRADVFVLRSHFLKPCQRVVVGQVDNFFDINV